MAEVTTELIDESQQERSMHRISASMTEEEATLSGAFSDVFGDASNDNNEKMIQLIAALKMPST